MAIRVTLTRQGTIYMKIGKNGNQKAIYGNQKAIYGNQKAIYGNQMAI